MAGRTTHVDVDDVGARGFSDLRGFAHEARFAARELHDMRADPARFAAQPRNRPALHHIVACGHFADHESRAQPLRQTPEGCIGHPGHWRKKSWVDEFNIADFQRLRMQISRAGHVRLAVMTDASSRMPRVYFEHNSCAVKFHAYSLDNSCDLASAVQQNLPHPAARARRNLRQALRRKFPEGPRESLRFARSA